jgi:2-polyprenyl-6-methoxyphenol hydroxylase-like FAD-dependent oxidoreductase
VKCNPLKLHTAYGYQIRSINDIPFFDPGFFGGFRAMKEAAPEVEVHSQIVVDITLDGLDSTLLPWTYRFEPSGYNILVPWVNADKPRVHGPDGFPIDKANNPQIYRVIFEVAAGDETRARDESDKEYIQKRFTEKFAFLLERNRADPQSLVIRNILWRSLFRIKVAMATKMHVFYPTSKANLLLVGDAAHVHSPAGGQGMNLAIRESIAAGKVIAAYHHSLLDSGESASPNLEPFTRFESQRQKETLRVLRMTRIMSWFWTSKDPIGKSVRMVVLSCASVIPSTGRLLALLWSGL